MTSRSDRREAGFTLLELLVVIAIIGLAAGIAATRAGSRPDLALAAGDARDLLRAARAQAIGANRTLLLLAQQAPPALGIQGARMVPLPAGIAFGDGTAAAIAFHPDGSTSGGALVIGDGRSTAMVTVDALTGRVRISRVR